MVAQSVVLGGHVRVGLEDNLFIAPGELAQGNAPLVERAVQIIQGIGEDVASPSDARKIYLSSSSDAYFGATVNSWRNNTTASLG